MPPFSKRLLSALLKLRSKNALAGTGHAAASQKSFLAGTAQGRLLPAAVQPCPEAAPFAKAPLGDQF